MWTLHTKMSMLRRFLSATTQWSSRCRWHSTISADTVLAAIKKQLNEVSPLREKQEQLMSHLLSAPSNNKQLSTVAADLNLTAKDVYKLGVATFQAHQSVGEGIEAAVKLFELSHSLGDTDSTYTYAQLLRSGQGCQSDPAKAAQLFTDLAMQAHPYAQFTLAGMYYIGLGVEQNYTKAFTLYKVSAQNMIPQGFTALGDMYSNGYGVEQDQQEAIRCYKRAADLGDPSAHLALAQCYNKAKGVELSFEKSFEHYLEASKSGNPVALYNVGIHYFAGKGTAHSFEKAAQYFQQAADLGFTPAQVNLGNMYYAGLGVEKDIEMAKQFYKMAANEDKNAELLLKELEMEQKDK